MENIQLKNFLVVFCDLTNFEKNSKKINEAELFNYLSDIYEITGNIIEASNGNIIKFIGDAALITFEENNIDNGITALKKLKTEIDSYNNHNNYESKLNIKAHFGKVAAGMIGTKSRKMYDIFGNTVNIAATLPSGGFVISEEVLIRLNTETQKMFKKHTTNKIYIFKECN